MRGQAKIPVSYCKAWIVVFFAVIQAACDQAHKEPAQRMKALLSLANQLPDDSREQMDFLDSAFSRIEDPGMEDRLELYGFKCAFYQRQRRFEEAFRYADSMLDLTVDKLGRPELAKWYASALASKGDIYLALKNYDESLSATPNRAFFLKKRLQTAAARICTPSVWRT
jgi:hypothetical protein